MGPGGQIRHQNVLCSDWNGGGEDPLGMPCGAAAQLQTTNQYNLFGMLTYQQRSGAPPVQIDSMRYDRSGNLSYQRHTTETHPFSYQMAAATGDGSDSTNVLLTKRDVVTGATERSYAYTLDLGRRHDLGGTVTTYWYDALGRTSGIAAFGSSSAPNSCLYDPDGQMARACHSGAQLLTFEGSNVGAAGEWRFVSGPGTDDPLIGIYRGASCVTTELYWITDGQGRQLAVGGSDGGFAPSQQQCYKSMGGAYAGGTQNAQGFGPDRFGSVNLPGFSFFRNRVYDQATGRWTQEDPIGVAGGLNLYQYAGNNPVAYTDPYGLCIPVCIAIGVGLGSFIAVVTNYLSNIEHGRDPDENANTAFVTGAVLGAAGEAWVAGGSTAGVAVGGEALLGRTAGTTWTTVQRAGVRAEAEATASTSLMRGGRPGTNWVTNSVPSSAKAAQSSLALPGGLPDVRMTLQVPADAVSASIRVPRAFGQPGGGTQRIVDNGALTRLFGVEPLKP